MQNTTILFFLLMTCSIYGQTPLITGQNQKFVHFDTSAGLILTESLQPGMTLYSLSRKYNTSVDVILASNPDLNPNTVPLGYPLNIHVHASKILFEPPAGHDDMIWLSYRVQPKETLYRISKIYLNIDPEVIVALNPTAQAGLRIGQVLHIGWLSSTSANDTHADNGTIPDSIQFLPKDFIKEAHSVGETIHEQKG